MKKGTLKVLRAIRKKSTLRLFIDREKLCMKDKYAFFYIWYALMHGYEIAEADGQRYLLKRPQADNLRTYKLTPVFYKDDTPYEF